MESFQDFVYFGGGGGYEIKNQIVGYRYETGNSVLTKIVHEELTGDSVANCMIVPRDVSQNSKLREAFSTATLPHFDQFLVS